MKAICKGLILLAVFISAPGCNGAERKMGKKMETQSVELPFHLKLSDLAKVEFACEYTPVQSKPWTESIQISGLTGVRLIRQSPGAAKPDTLLAKQDPLALVTLLKQFEDNGFFEKEVDVDPESKDPIRYISLSVPGQSNRVAVGGRYQYALGALVGAVKLAAGFSVPEALGKSFLKEL